MVSSKKLASRLVRERAGNFGIMTAIIMVPLAMAAALAVNYTSASLKHTDMQEIADAAALAGGRVYDGTNSAAAITAAKSFLTGYNDKLPAGYTYDVGMSGSTTTVSIKATSANSIVDIGNMDKVPVSVAASAVTPDKPQSITFTPTQAQGYYWKKVSIIVVRPNSTAEVVVGTVTYQPTTHDNSGQGTMTVSPSGTIDLGKYSKLVLQMDIKNDGCALGYKAVVSGSAVSCSATKSSTYAKYSLTLRTDNPATSYYLFVDGVQLPAGVTSPLEAILECNKTINHAWEDGGGWARQDFFYTAKSVCSPDGQYVRLTK